MEKLKNISTYKDFKEALSNELKNQTQGFVRTGYLLKVARDTDILNESGYTSVAEFAKGEYGLSKDVVSRYIAINDKYSKNSYSDELEDRYTDFGIAKLQEMLTLPDSVVDLLTPDISKRELQALRREIREEENITDIEVMLEEEPEGQQDMSLLGKMLHSFFSKDKGKFAVLREKMQEVKDESAAVECLLDVLAPSGVGILTARVSGTGKLLLSFNGADNPPELLNVRSGKKEDFSWSEFVKEINNFIICMEDGEWGEDAEGLPKEENSKVAPVQPESVYQEEKKEENDTEGTQEADSVIEGAMNAPVYQEEETEEIETGNQEEDEPEKCQGVIEEKSGDAEEIEATKIAIEEELEQLKEYIGTAQWDAAQMSAADIVEYAKNLEYWEEKQKRRN